MRASLKNVAYARALATARLRKQDLLDWILSYTLFSPERRMSEYEWVARIDVESRHAVEKLKASVSARRLQDSSPMLARLEELLFACSRAHELDLRTRKRRA